jgi:putative (di)nucleoside polyphosphate hydrolase
MSPKKLPLRPNVCMLVYNSKGKLFLGERVDERGHWQFPQGGAEPRYSLKENVLRELKEELGISCQHVGKVKRLTSRHQYEWRSPPKYANGKWRGQKQTFWLVEFLGDDSDLDLASFHEPEFRSWLWCSVAEVRRRAAPHRLPGYSGALTEFLAFKRQKRATSPQKKAPQRRIVARAAASKRK